VPSGFSCPKRPHLELGKVTYSNIVLTDTTNNVTTTVPDVADRSSLPCSPAEAIGLKLVGGWADCLLPNSPLVPPRIFWR